MSTARPSDAGAPSTTASHAPASDPTPAPAARRPITARERDYQHTILGAAKATGWRTAHFRPGRTTHGWRTAVEGDGKGFPDLLLVHPDAGFVWFVEVKRDDNRRLDPEQEAWRHDLIAAGAVHRVVHVPSGLDAFLGDLTDARTTRLRAKRMGME